MEAVNAGKSQLLLALRGPDGKLCLKHHLKRTPQGTFVRIPEDAHTEELLLPLVTQIKYLGVVMSFRFEDLALQKRLQCAELQRVNSLSCCLEQPAFSG